MLINIELLLISRKEAPAAYFALSLCILLFSALLVFNAKVLEPTSATYWRKGKLQAFLLKEIS